MQDDAMLARIMARREMMKGETALDEGGISDQSAGVPQPPLANPFSGESSIPLTRDFRQVVRDIPFTELIDGRVSRRRFSDRPLTLDELAFLLWATQGVKRVIGKSNHATLRTVPSAGARHGLEPYLLVFRVGGLAPGLDHYLALEHRLEFLRPVENAEDRITEASCGQPFLAAAAVDFLWTAVPYRSEWRYTDQAQKYLLLDAGHVCQNLYLACEAIGCGTCAIGAYDQALMDGLVGLPGGPSCDEKDEFVVYAAPVGRPE